MKLGSNFKYILAHLHTFPFAAPAKPTTPTPNELNFSIPTERVTEFFNPHEKVLFASALHVPPSLKKHRNKTPLSFLFCNFSMGHSKTMPLQGRTTSLGLWVVALALFLAASDGQMAVPSTGQLCISDCSTCPVICTAPPPPRSYSSYIPPPSPELYGGYMAPPLPMASPVLTWTPPPAPPSSYFFWGPPPPVSNYFSGAQPSGQMPQTAGPRDYSYPYYYFYSSNSCSFSSLSTFVVLFVCLFHFVF